MKLRTLGLGLALSLVLSAGSFACSSADPTDLDDVTVDEGADALKNSVKVTEKDAGKTIAVEQGKVVALYLAANPSTGYGWSVVATDKTFGYPEEKFFASSGATGAGGTSRFVWKTDGPLSTIGKHSVTLEYKRAWEKKAAKSFTFVVDVRAAAAKSVAIGASDDGKTFAVKQGQDVVVSLPANATTGYEWSVLSTDKSFGYPEESYVASGSSVGGGGTSIFTWHTSTPFALGRHTVKLQYKRDWEAKAIDTFTFTVNVAQ
jgi:inhibitor of cysteine peptidase